MKIFKYHTFEIKNQIVFSVQFFQMKFKDWRQLYMFVTK